ncbi:hypothetical protein M446_4673 [Methylobacterium sp. 4-46]|uniref:hypothetical protein n=1 Tax=unclassified Methylobacterium TaxID=2615210 RepID=UPI000152CE8D|nr:MULTISPECIES: hypothetical protein [Methylobacterium]ACA19012.1 hypothetical protein M446_4673 [Methylobacterium sp. 4-46]WFT78226.1 hypothetical protein QA634_23490 [Methylobacterium nodulans]
MDAQQQEAIATRFNTDERFRHAMLADPNQVIKTEFGIDLPFSLTVEASQNGYRFLPVEAAGEAIDEAQLDAVVGGAGLNLSWGSISSWFSNTFFRGGARLISEHGAGIVAGNTSRIVAPNTSR